MSAMIYENGAWKEADTPKIWNGSAYADTDGYCWENGVQKEGWSAALYIYKAGMINPIAGQLKTNYTSNNGDANGSPVFNSSNIYCDSNTSNAYDDKPCGIVTTNTINVSGYKKLCMEAMVTAKPSVNAWVDVIVCTSNTEVQSHASNCISAIHQANSTLTTYESIGSSMSAQYQSTFNIQLNQKQIFTLDPALINKTLSDLGNNVYICCQLRGIPDARITGYIYNIWLE